jgi:catechol 2,3-dioxygenase-like lactoylglutathione lyase family enzyme
MRGGYNHLDLTLADTQKSRPLYEAALGYMGYQLSAHDDGYCDFALGGTRVCSAGLRNARTGAPVHDRFAPGLHHIAWTADSRDDVDGLFAILRREGATVLDAPADYPWYGTGYYALFFADADGLKLEYVFKPEPTPVGRVRGAIHHVDLSVREPRASRDFYDAVFGFMGYVVEDDHARGFDLDRATPEGFCSLGIMRATGAGAARAHDRHSPGLHHIAWTAESRADVDAMFALLQRIGATVLDPPADYPRYGPGYYAVFFTDPDGLKLEFVFTP